MGTSQQREGEAETQGESDELEGSVVDRGSLTPLSAAGIRDWFAQFSGVRPRETFVVPPAEMQHRDGYCWTVNLPQFAAEADDCSSESSSLLLFEDDLCLSPARSAHDAIATTGRGAYSHWDKSLLFSTSDGSDPTTNGRSYVVVSVDHGVTRPDESERSLVGPFVSTGGFRWRARLPGGVHLSDEGQRRYSHLVLHEDTTELGPAHSYHQRISDDGGGRYSHWGHDVYFSTSDGSDPNSSGRRYSWSLGPRSPTQAGREKRAYLDRWYRKRELFLEEPTSLWSLHPEGDWFREHGGDAVAPPIYSNLVGLTSYCNLKCTICGSQEAIDHEGTPRRNMKPEVMHAVANTLFPSLSVLILASLGEPTIYPHFNEVLEQAHRWGTSIKIESNATALTPKMIKLLTSVRGELFFSLDATGDIFENVRKGAVWKKAQQNVINLLAARDRELTKVNLYPTISRKTLPDMINVAKWALEAGIEEITFHSYDPTMFAQEERPTAEEFALQNDVIREWLDKESKHRDLSDFSVKVNGVEINARFSAESLGLYPLAPMPKNHPCAEVEYPDNAFRCSNPRQNVDIGPDGEMYPCVWSGARPQENTMGYATSKESFAQAWFGPRYRELREQLRVGGPAETNVAQCAVCLKRYAKPGDQMG